MKKINTTKLVSLLAVLCMITSAFVGSTLAKYTTSGEGTDSARVAKFGVTVTAKAENDFATTYASDTTEYSANTVVSTDAVVAPGTEGKLADVTLSGTPEVAVKVTNKGTIDFGENWKDKDGNYYCPIEVTVEGTSIKGLDKTSIEDFEQAIADEIEKCKAEYAAGTDLSNAVDDKAAPTISWKWAYEGNDDVKDTYLGDQAANGSAATISIKVETTVTQID